MVLEGNLDLISFKIRKSTNPKAKSGLMHAIAAFNPGIAAATSMVNWRSMSIYKTSTSLEVSTYLRVVLTNQGNCYPLNLKHAN